MFVPNSSNALANLKNKFLAPFCKSKHFHKADEVNGDRKALLACNSKSQKFCIANEEKAANYTVDL